MISPELQPEVKIHLPNKKTIYNKTYYDKNKETILLHLNTKMYCEDCKKELVLHHMSRHRKTKHHLQNVDNKNN